MCRGVQPSRQIAGHRAFPPALPGLRRDLYEKKITFCRCHRVATQPLPIPREMVFSQAPDHRVYTVNNQVYAVRMTLNSEQHRGPLSAGSIASCGVAVADSNGLEAVSMRRIAEALGVSAMALYRHVESRESLLLAMAAETGRDFMLLPASPATWQEMLRHLASSLWDGFAEHPWLLQIVLGPSRLLDMASTSDLEDLLGTLRATGLPDDDCFDCVLGIAALAIGTASLAFAANPGPGSHHPTRPNAVVPLNAADAARPGSIVASFRNRGITYEASRKSLDFAVDGFLRGIEVKILKTTRTQQTNESGPEKENQ